MFPLRLFVARDVLYAAKQGGGTITGYDDAHNLVVGGVALFTENNTLITAATSAADLARISKFRIVTNDVNGVNTSVLIDRAAFAFAKHAYAAAVVAVQVVGESASASGSLNLPSPLVAGTYASLVITDTSEGEFQAGLVTRFEVPVTSASTASSIVLDLIAKINNNPSSIVTASAVAGNVGIILTAKSGIKSFLVGVDEILENAVIHNDGTNGSAIYSAGRGTLAELTAMQLESDLAIGKTASGGQEQFWWKRTSEIAASGITGFEMWVFSHATEVRSGERVAPVATIDTVLAYPPGSTATTGIEDVLAGIFGVVITVPESGSGVAPVLGS